MISEVFSKCKDSFQPVSGMHALSPVALFSQTLVDVHSELNPTRISPMNHWVKPVGIPPGEGPGARASAE